MGQEQIERNRPKQPKQQKTNGQRLVQKIWNDGELVKSPIGRSVGAITIKEQSSGVEPKQNRTEQNKRSKRELER